MGCVCVWYRYVDDTFLLLKDKNNAIELLEWLNAQHRNIKFTCELGELEKGSSNKFVSTLYRNKTFTGVYLHWNSLTSRKYKIGLIKILFDRIWKICSNYEFIHE